MTRIRKIAAALFLISFAVAAGLSAQEKMTLQQFIDEAVRNSASVQIAGEAVAGAGFKVKEAKSQTLPQLSVAGTYTRISLVNEFDIPGLGHFKFSTADNLGFRAAASAERLPYPVEVRSSGGGDPLVGTLLRRARRRRRYGAPQ